MRHDRLAYLIALARVGLTQGVHHPSERDFGQAVEDASVDLDEVTIHRQRSKLAGVTHEGVAGRMSQVSTVRGPVEVADLGPTYMHEHIFVLTADVQQNYPGEWGSEDERVTDAVTNPPTCMSTLRAHR